MAREKATSPTPTAPPLAPRQISGKYIWRLLVTDSWGTTAFIFGLLGAIFRLVGAVLTLVIITDFVDIPFLFLGLVFLVLALRIGT